MGGGIWAMHFVGMLAFSLPCGITYDAVGTLLSMIPGMLASGIALGTISRPHAPGLSRLTVSAVLMGAGIAAMHYSGMAAMRPEALLRYDPGLVAISVVVAAVLAFVSLSIRFRASRLQSSPMVATIIAASVMGCASPACITQRCRPRSSFRFRTRRPTAWPSRRHCWPS